MIISLNKFFTIKKQYLLSEYRNLSIEILLKKLVDIAIKTNCKIRLIPMYDIKEDICNSDIISKYHVQSYAIYENSCLTIFYSRQEKKHIREVLK